MVWIFLWIFSCFESASSMFCLKLLLILNLTNVFLSKTTFRSIFVSKTTFESIFVSWACPYRFKNLYPSKKSPRLWLDSWQNLYRFSPKLSLWLPSLIRVGMHMTVVGCSGCLGWCTPWWATQGEPRSIPHTRRSAPEPQVFIFFISSHLFIPVIPIFILGLRSAYAVNICRLQHLVVTVVAWSILLIYSYSICTGTYF